MVGRSIAEIYNRRWHIYQGTKLQGKCTTDVVYRGYRPTYCIICNIIYIIYYGREVYSWYLYNPRWHTYQTTKCWGKCTAEVLYKGYRLTYRIICNVYRLTYHIIYNIYFGECTTDKPFTWKHFPKRRHFCSKDYYANVGPPHNA